MAVEELGSEVNVAYGGMQGLAGTVLIFRDISDLEKLLAGLVLIPA